MAKRTSRGTVIQVVKDLGKIRVGHPSGTPDAGTKVDIGDFRELYQKPCNS